MRIVVEGRRVGGGFGGFICFSVASPQANTTSTYAEEV